MLFAVALAAIFSTSNVDESNRFRKVYESGAIALIEPRTDAKTVAVQLFAAAKACPETRETHGWRHLLEHQLVKGNAGDLGARLEAKSWISTAETYRDFMVFRLEGPPSGLPDAIAAIGEILQPSRWEIGALEIERKILGQEIALLPISTRLSNQAWALAYGDAGLDPIGELASIERATPDDLLSLHAKQFAADGLTISIVGPVDPAKVEALFASAIRSAPPALKATWKKRPIIVPGETDLYRGSALYAPAPGYANPLTAWTLAAAMAIGSEASGRFVTYTPSLQNGLILVGSSRDLRVADSLVTIQKNPAAYFQSAKELAKAWYARSRRSVSDQAFSNGSFQVQALGGRPETLLENIEMMRPEDFQKGVEAFVVGAKR